MLSKPVYPAKHDCYYLTDLAQRWQDESEYEDFEEYKHLIAGTFKRYGYVGINIHMAEGSLAFLVEASLPTTKWKFKIEPTGMSVYEVTI